jgi:hypothetical protein
VAAAGSLVTKFEEDRRVAVLADDLLHRQFGRDAEQAGQGVNAGVELPSAGRSNNLSVLNA